MKKQLVIDTVGDTTRICVLEDGELTETLAASESKKQIGGSIFLGRVQNVRPGLDAAFVDIGLDKNAILSGLTDLENDPQFHLSVKSGMEIPVQVTKLPGGEKGVAVSMDIRIAGRLSVLLPFGSGASVSRRVEDGDEYRRLKLIAQKCRPQGMGVILRTNAAGEDESTISRDINLLAEQWNAIDQKAKHLKAPCLLLDESDILYKAARDIFSDEFEEVVFSKEILYNKFLEYTNALAPRLKSRLRLTDTKNLFALYRVESQLEKARQRCVWLPGGGCIVIDPTEAMTVIDVNSGKSAFGGSVEQNIFKLNLEAAREIMKQLRLRDTGGIIVVDFVDMADKNDKTALLNELKTLAGADRNRTSVIDMTPLGLVEMTRKRKNEGLN